MCQARARAKSEIANADFKWVKMGHLRGLRFQPPAPVRSSWKLPVWNAERNGRGLTVAAEPRGRFGFAAMSRYVAHAAVAASALAR